MHPKDRLYFQSFCRDARQAGRSLEEHYVVVQTATHTDAHAIHNVPTPQTLKGMKMARDYMQRDDSILVVGCGVGYEVGWFQEHGFRHITGLDVSPERLEVCASRYGIPTICADMTQTGLPDTNFDHVLTRQSLHHLFYPFHALEELARIARRSVIIISEPARTWFKETYRRLFGHRIISGANIYEYQFPEQDLHRYMAFNGFELVRCRRYLEMPQIPWPVHELASALAPMLRNRFTTIYERM